MEKLTKSSLAETSQLKTKKRKMEEQFYQIIPNVTSNEIKISVDTSGNVDVYFLEKVDTIDERSLCKVPYTAFLYKIIVFSLLRLVDLTDCRRWLVQEKGLEE